MKLSERLEQAGLTLPEVAKPVAAYVPARRFGDSNLVCTSGQLPVINGELLEVGQVSEQAQEVVGFSQFYVNQQGNQQVLHTPLVSPAQAYDCARVCALNALAAAAAAAGGVDRILQALKVTVFVSSAPDFYGQAQVANGASQLFQELFETGHIRSAVGVAVLPLNSPVEVEVEFLTSEDGGN